MYSELQKREPRKDNSKVTLWFPLELRFFLNLELALVSAWQSTDFTLPPLPHSLPDFRKKEGPP